MILTMREVNISGLDLNLLPPLEALLRHCNVTHAAADAGLSQPAMSRALFRLRQIFDDPLLVRSHGKFVLTPKAQSLEPRVRAALNDMKGLFEEPRFDPALERRIIRIAATDTQTVLLFPAVMARLARDAPGIDVRIDRYGPELFVQLDNGSLDLAFALTTSDLPPGAMSEHISSDRLALIMRKGHPAARRAWTLADYGTVNHVSVSIFGDGRSELDTLLAAVGVTRRIALVTPHFTAALAAVSETDMVTTLSENFAERYRDTFNLVLLKPPFEDTELHVTMVWSHLRNSDKVLSWFRGVVRDVAREVATPPLT
jgi:DNA-binding transcriptional LysR family regulator